MSLSCLKSVLFLQTIVKGLQGISLSLLLVRCNRTQLECMPTDLQQMRKLEKIQRHPFLVLLYFFRRMGLLIFPLHFSLHHTALLCGIPSFFYVSLQPFPKRRFSILIDPFAPIHHASFADVTFNQSQTFLPHPAFWLVHFWWDLSLYDGTTWFA